MLRILWITAVLFCSSVFIHANAAHKDIVLQLKWKHQFQFAGFYAALEQGYYKEAGLNVNIVPASTSDPDTVPKVLSGEADFGLANSGLLLRRIQGQPLVALFATFQSSPYCWMVKSSSDIFEPSDFKDKRIVYFNTAEGAELLAMLYKHGITESQLQLVNGRVSTQDWLEDKLDAVQAYITNEPYLMEQKGVSFRTLCPKSFGLNFYADILFTREDLIEKHPDMVRKFYSASIRGWRYAMDHKQEMVALILEKYSSDKTRSQLEYEARVMDGLTVRESAGIGHMNYGRWRFIAETYRQVGILKQDAVLDGFLYRPEQNETFKLSWMLILGLIVMVISLPFYVRLFLQESNRKRPVISVK